MKEWILENTSITEEEYDSIINEDTILMHHKPSTKYIQDDNNPLINIAKFTLKKPSFFNRKKFKIIKKDNSYVYKEIEFYVLAEFLTNIKAWLYSTERLHQCFILNSYICKELKANCHLITALCKSPYGKDNQEYVHSFIIVITDNNQEYIIDGVTNTIMKKETYFNLYNPKIISNISQKRLREEIPLINKFSKHNKISRGEYLCFPDQIITAVKKLIK